MMTTPFYSFPEPEDKEVEVPVLRDPWDIHVELVQAARILEQMKQGAGVRSSKRDEILKQLDLIENLRAEHMRAVLGGFAD